MQPENNQLKATCIHCNKEFHSHRVQEFYDITGVPTSVPALILCDEHYEPDIVKCFPIRLSEEGGFQIAVNEDGTHAFEPMPFSLFKIFFESKETDEMMVTAQHHGVALVQHETLTKMINILQETAMQMLEAELVEGDKEDVQSSDKEEEAQ